MLIGDSLVASYKSSSSFHTLRCTAPTRTVTTSKCSLQFITGLDEMAVPDVKLTRSRDGSNGQAIFVFQNPSVFENDSEVVQSGEITGLYMTDEEGTLQTTDVQVKFIDGKPAQLIATYVMKSAFQWDRFMRFMERYANENGLGFNKA